MLVQPPELCLSPVLPDHEGAGEVAGIQRGTVTSHAVVVHTGLAFHPPGHVSLVTGSSAHEQQSPIRASRRDTSADLEQDSSVSRVACIKRPLQSEGICANASGVLSSIDGIPVGQYPLVVRLLKGVLNLRITVSS